MKKIIFLTSYVSLSLTNMSYSQEGTPIVKDSKGNDLQYCKDYSLKTDNESETIELLFNSDVSAYYLIKNSEPQNSQNTFQIKPKDESTNKCGLPVFVKDQFSIEFVDIAHNNKFLTYQKSVNIFSHSYYYSGINKFSEFSLQESLNKDIKGYNLVNVGDNTILFCNNSNAVCTSTPNKYVQNSNFVFIPKENTIDPNQLTPETSLGELLKQFKEKAEEEISRWKEQAQHLGNLTKEELGRFNDQINAQTKKLEEEANRFGDKAAPELQRLKEESERVSQQVQTEYNRIERQVKEVVQEVQTGYNHIENQVKDFFSGW